MALFDALKKATGLGLSPQELFDRAYEKGVLLGPAQFSRAIELFDEAAVKAQQVGDATTAARARANSALYSFVTQGGDRHLEVLAESLRQLPDIERVGSRTERWAAKPLLGEIEARLLEGGIRELSSDAHASLASAHTRVAAAFRDIFNAPLITYAYHSLDPHRDKASTRYFLHHGLANQHEALAMIARNPEGAAEKMSTALAAFRQCGDAAQADTANRWLVNATQRRTCWMCHREFQGATTHYKSHRATVLPYVERVVQELSQDISTLSSASSTLVLCTPCSSGVESVAATVIEERTRELRRRLEASEANVMALVQRVAQLEARR